MKSPSALSSGIFVGSGLIVTVVSFPVVSGSSNSTFTSVLLLSDESAFPSELFSEPLSVPCVCAAALSESSTAVSSVFADSISVFSTAAARTGWIIAAR